MGGDALLTISPKPRNPNCYWRGQTVRETKWLLPKSTAGWALRVLDISHQKIKNESRYAWFETMSSH